MTQFIKIEWDASPSPISGYNVYRAISGGTASTTPLNNSPITDLFYDDYTIFPGQAYSYTVTAVLNGIESLSSLEILTEPIAFENSPSPLNLNAFGSFGLLASSTITNVPGTESIITGDVGVYPGSSITGFETVRISGSYHLADYVAGYGQTSLTSSFVSGMTLTGTSMPAELGGLRLLPGVYTNATSVAITGVLVLDGQGNPDAAWVFQVGTTLTTAAANSHVVLVGGAQADNITWLVGSSATLGTDTFFAGNIIAYASITVNTNACVNGRLGARTGAITLDDNSVVVYGACVQALPTAPPNEPPAPPAPPTGVFIDDLNADGLDNNIPILATVSTTAITNITNTSAISGGNVLTDGYGTIISRGICFGNQINPDINSQFTSNGNTLGNYTSTLTGLIPSTSYYLRAYVTNSVGTSYGENITFTTIQ